MWHNVFNYPDPYELVIAYDKNTSISLLRWSGKEWLKDLTPTYEPHIIQWAYAFESFISEDSLPKSNVVVMGKTISDSIFLCRYKDDRWIDEDTKKDVAIIQWSYISE
jgi:hypothetical protein